MGRKTLGLCSLFDLIFMIRLCSVYSLDDLESALDHPYSADLGGQKVEELVQRDMEKQLQGSKVTNMKHKKYIMDDLRSAVRANRDYNRPAEIASRVFSFIQAFDMEGLPPTLRRHRIMSLSRLPPHLRHRLQVSLDIDDTH